MSREMKLTPAFSIGYTDANGVDHVLSEHFVEDLPEEDSPKTKVLEYKKKTIYNRIRWQIWERDNFTCQHCGSRKNLTIDHIIPESKGGKLVESNLQTLCHSCNSRKGAR